MKPPGGHQAPPRDTAATEAVEDVPWRSGRPRESHWKVRMATHVDDGKVMGYGSLLSHGGTSSYS